MARHKEKGAGRSPRPLSHPRVRFSVGRTETYWLTARPHVRFAKPARRSPGRLCSRPGLLLFSRALREGGACGARACQ